MAENEQDLLTYARKIQNYCKSVTCVDECVFYRHREDDCSLGGFSPNYWNIPRGKRRADNDAGRSD